MIVRNLLDDSTREARVTTDHAASSHGQPAVVLEDGTAIDPAGWLVLGWHPDEAAALGPAWPLWDPYAN